MDIKVALSIYNKQWLIQQGGAVQLLDMWDKITASEVSWDYSKVKGGDADSSYKIHEKFFATSGITIAPQSSWDMADFKGFEGSEIAVIPISGPLMKSDFCGSFGTNTLKQLTMMASNTPSVKTIIYLIDSPGGTVDGTQALADAIRMSGKETIAICDGDMCSAAYWIGSSCNMVYASGETDIIGCIGTMISMKDGSEALKAKGIVSREYYATGSQDKNKAATEALKGNGELLITELLDPLNDVFLKSVRNNRPDVKEEALTGKDYTSQRAMEAGLIDGIKSFEQVVKEQKSKTTTATLSIFNKSKMAEITTLSDLKAQAPSVYDAAVEIGATAERKRINSLLKWRDVDATTIDKAISDGSRLDEEMLSDLTEKKISQALLKGAEAQNAKDIKTTVAASVPKTDAQNVADNSAAEFLKMCGIKDEDKN